MKISKLFCVLCMALSGLQTYAQIDNSVDKPDLVKSLDYRCYTVKMQNDTIVKDKQIVLFEGYPIRYPVSTLYFDKSGNTIKEDRTHQSDKIYYNTANQKIKMVLYPDGKNDSITFNYAYDDHGNIETVTKNASAPKMDFSLGANHYTYEALRDEVYKNYYLSDDNSKIEHQFESINPEANYTYRLYNAKNKLIQEKNRYGSRIRTIKYEYNNENKITKVSTIDNYTDVKTKHNTSIETEEHNYLNDGLIHDIKYSSNNKIWKEEQTVYRSNGSVKEYTSHYFNRENKYTYNAKGELEQFTLRKLRKDKIIRNIRLLYTYNSRGDWIKCIHFDKKNQPTYLIERIIAYH